MFALTQTELGGATERGADAAAFEQVVLLRAGAVGIDVRDIARHEVRRSQRDADQLLQRVAVGVEARDVAGIVENAAAEHFGINRGAAFLGMVEPLEHEHRRRLRP